VRGDLGPAIGALKRDCTTAIRTIGSMALVNGMLRLGLVNRLRIMTFPLTLGADGHQPAYAGYPRAGFELIRTKVLDSRLVLVEYRPVPA
jgi:hypothetical protein